jgi:hypothetical protein
MGWLNDEDWRDAPQLALADEANLLHSLSDKTRSDVRLLGVDAYGIDCETKKQRLRSDFNTPSSLFNEIEKFSAASLNKLSQ